MDKLNAHIQEEVLLWILFTDGIVLVDESRDDINAKLKRLQEASNPML